MKEVKVDSESINKKFIYVLKRINDGQEVQLYELPIKNPFKQQLDEIRELIKKGYKSIDIIGKIEELNSATGVFSMDAWYCDDYIDSYVFHNTLSYYNSVTSKEINEKFDDVEVESQKLKALLQVINYAEYAYPLDIAYKSVVGMKDVISYSHSVPGRREQVCRIDEKLTIVISVNFGYGSNSYFRVDVKYMDQLVMRLSEWVETENYVDIGITSCTRRYLPLKKYWYNAMCFIREITNEYLNSESDFIMKYIISEIDKLVVGLENVLSQKKFVLKNVYEKPVIHEFKYMQLIEFRGRKLVDAIPIITLIKKYEVPFSIEEYINRFNICLLKLIPILKQELINMDNKLKDLIPKLDLLERRDDDELRQINIDFKREINLCELYIERYNGFIKDIGTYLKP